MRKCTRRRSVSLFLTCLVFLCAAFPAFSRDEEEAAWPEEDVWTSEEEPNWEPEEEAYEEPWDAPGEEPYWGPEEEPYEEPYWEPGEEPFEEPYWEPGEEPFEEPYWEPGEEPYWEPEEEPSSPAIHVTVPYDYWEPLTGRLLFLVDFDVVPGAEVFHNCRVRGCYVAGKTVYDVQPGETITITLDDAEVYGYPMPLSEIEPGEYVVQAFFIKYTEYHRSDGHTIWAMADHGGGGNFILNPYNLFSDNLWVNLWEEDIYLTLSYAIPHSYDVSEWETDQQGNYEDTELVKYVKIRSELLSDFWGCDMYIGANVLLPADYDPKKSYPVLYDQGHFPWGSAPCDYGVPGNSFNEYWNSDVAPDMIVVTTRDACQFYDTSYSVNSANTGPWGDAYVYELIPYIEETFHGIAEPWARILSGGSTGGWEAMALQVFYPDFFGGTWPICPDSMDFHAVELVNMYDDDNAYYIDNGWTRVERPAYRDELGNIYWTVPQENHWETAIGGGEAISLGQWAIWDAVYSPVDEDGYPARVFDPVTGEINHDVVAYWQENYDLHYIMRTNWDTLGEKLAGKIHLRGGDMDSFYLNLSQYLITDFLESTGTDYGYSVTFPRIGHSGNITNEELFAEIGEYLIKTGPKNVKEILGWEKKAETTKVR